MSGAEDDFDDLLDEAAEELQQKLHIENEEEKKAEPTPVAQPVMQPQETQSNKVQPGAFGELGIGEEDFQAALKDILKDEGDSKEALAGISQMMNFLGSQLKDMPDN